MLPFSTTVRSSLADLSASLGVLFTGEGWYHVGQGGAYLVLRADDRGGTVWECLYFHRDPRPDFQRAVKLPDRGHARPACPAPTGRAD